MHPYTIVCKDTMCIFTYIKGNAEADTKVHIG